MLSKTQLGTMLCAMYIKVNPSVLSAMLAGALLVVGFVPFADASTVLASTIEELTASSGAVVRGVVTETYALEREERVVTLVRLEVAEVLRGQTPVSITIETPSGRDGEITTFVSGSDFYSVGQEVVVFVEEQPNGYWRSVALSWGKFLLIDGMAIRDPAGLAFVRRNDKGRFTSVTLTPEEVAMTYEELRDRITNAGTSF